MKLRRTQPGFYTDGRVSLWQEGEGPDKGKWFFDLGIWITGVSEPYATKREARAAMEAALVNVTTIGP